jgi:hypothetical protein
LVYGVDDHGADGKHLLLARTSVANLTSDAKLDQAAEARR